ncbi:unnamed protein product [Mesocestoides corti]|uniref:Uncharacterized protein n=1 Tax=Mesocestoides corti TaxID=53468 RepID=A0A0R3U1C8_MESCO|nr:unnamed protein product [Mesocestoides corti]
MDNTGLSPLSTTKSDVTFHPNSTNIAKRCKQANETATKQLSLDMMKLNLEQRKACQRVEKERDLFCQEFLEVGDSGMYRRKLSETTRPRYLQRAQRSKTIDLRQIQGYSPLRTSSKGACFTFDDVSQGMRRTASLKASTSSASLSSFHSNSPVLSERQQQQQQQQKTAQGGGVGDRRTSTEEAQPDWQVALALRRKHKLSQLQIFREQGHWGEDGCKKATAMLSGCPFNPVSPDSTALSHASELFNKTEGNENIE